LQGVKSYFESVRQERAAVQKKSMTHQMGHLALSSILLAMSVRLLRERTRHREIEEQSLLEKQLLEEKLGHATASWSQLRSLPLFNNTTNNAKTTKTTTTMLQQNELIAQLDSLLTLHAEEAGEGAALTTTPTTTTTTTPSAGQNAQESQPSATTRGTTTLF
jgi:hypothetical protein